MLIWIDYSVLRQCCSDFTPKYIAAVVKHIGNTLAVEDEAMTYLGRSFCLFELACTPATCLTFPDNNSRRDANEAAFVITTGVHVFNIVGMAAFTIVAYLMLAAELWSWSAAAVWTVWFLVVPSFLILLIALNLAFIVDHSAINVTISESRFMSILYFLGGPALGALGAYRHRLVSREHGDGWVGVARLSEYGSLWGSVSCGLAFVFVAFVDVFTSCYLRDLQPGKLGIGLYNGSIIDDVIKGGVAHTAGVKEWWKFETIDGETFSDALFQAKKNGHAAYTATFLIPMEVQLDIRDLAKESEA